MTSAAALSPISAQTFEVRPFDAPVGAEIIGLDISKPISDADFARIHRAHLDHHVVVFRDQQVSPSAQIAFSRRFGPLEIHVLHQFHLAGHPEILIVSNIKENGEPIGLGDEGCIGILIFRTNHSLAWVRCCMRKSYPARVATPCLPTSISPGRR